MDTWLDARDLATGAGWDQSVKSAIEAAAGFVFLIGPPGPDDRWQVFEWQQIIDHEYYLDASKPLIPVLIDEAEVPGFLKTRKAMVLRDTPNSSEEIADHIVAALKNPASSIDQAKLERAREAQRRALESFREYSQALEAEDIKHAGIRAVE